MIAKNFATKFFAMKFTIFAPRLLNENFIIKKNETTIIIRDGATACGQHRIMQERRNK